jgi:hypothetical protein
MLKHNIPKRPLKLARRIIEPKLYYLLLVIIFFQSCKKITIQEEIQTTPLTNFFNHVKHDKELDKAITNLQGQALQKDFTEDFINLNGKVFWDNAFKVTNDENNFAFIIPTKKEFENQFGAFLIISCSQGIFNYELHTRYALEANITEPTIYNLFAKNIQDIFDYFDLNILHLNLKRFIPNSEISEYIEIKEVKIHSDILGKMDDCVYTCHGYTDGNGNGHITYCAWEGVHCGESGDGDGTPPGGGGQGGGGTGGGGSTGGGGTWGGTGGVGTWGGTGGVGTWGPIITNPNPTPIGGGGGCPWYNPICGTPPPPPPPNPCSYMIQLSADANFVNKIKSLNIPSVLNATKEYGHTVNNRQINEYTAVEGLLNSPEITWSIVGQVDGFLHCHYNGLNNVPSPEDLVFMARVFLSGLARDTNNLFFGVTNKAEWPIIVKINDVAKFRAFAIGICGIDGNDKNKADNFIETYTPLFRTDNFNQNKVEFLKMIKKKAGNNGLALMQAEDDDCTSWNRLELDFAGTGYETNACPIQ